LPNDKDTVERLFKDVKKGIFTIEGT